MLEKAMMLPEPRSAMPRPNSRIRRKVPFRFRSTIRSNSSSVISRSGFLTLMLGFLPDALGIRHVQLQRLSFAAFGPDPLDRAFGSLFIHVRAEDLRPEGGEPVCPRLPDTPPCSYHERFFAGEVEHQVVVKHARPFRGRSTWRSRRRACRW